MNKVRMKYFMTVSICHHRGGLGPEESLRCYWHWLRESWGGIWGGNPSEIKNMEKPLYRA